MGGVAFNPLAYTAGSSFDKDAAKDQGFGYKDVFSKPQIGAWYVNLPNAARTGADWTTVGIAETFFKRLEVSYGFEDTNVNKTSNVHKNSFGGKLLLLEENTAGLKFLPAVSVGAINKNTTGDFIAKSLGLTGTDSSSWDYYLVATKLVTELPIPVLFSAGALSTQGIATGVLGFDSERKTTFFGNIDFIPIKQLAVGFEYKQGARFRDVKNADYYDVHAAWFVNKSFTVIAAYVNAGASDLTRRSVGQQAWLGRRLHLKRPICVLRT